MDAVDGSCICANYFMSVLYQRMVAKKVQKKHSCKDKEHEGT